MLSIVSGTRYHLKTVQRNNDLPLANGFIFHPGKETQTQPEFKLEKQKRISPTSCGLISEFAVSLVTRVRSLVQNVFLFDGN